MNPLQFDQKTLSQLFQDEEFRKTSTNASFEMFFHFYLSDYVKHPTALYQKEMMDLAQDPTIRTLAIMAYRGSAKSTIITQAYALWAIKALGVKCVLLLFKNQQMASTGLGNIKKALEENTMLAKDFGTIEERVDPWSKYEIYIQKYDASIFAFSSEQNVRGLRFKEHRPQLIICDDLEDIESAKTEERREKLNDFFKSEVIPCGDQDSKIIVLGNNVHPDSLMNRIIREMDEGKMSGVYRKYPIVDETGTALWPGKFPNQEAIAELEKQVGSDRAFKREMMLQHVEDEDQMIKDDWIVYGEQPKDLYLKKVFIGVDPAASSGEKSDYTAIVTALYFNERGSDKLETAKVYILDNILNAHLTYEELISKILSIYKQVRGTYRCEAEVHIENVGFQNAIIEMLKKVGQRAHGFNPKGQSKAERLFTVSHLFEKKQIIFPDSESGRRLAHQVKYFNTEAHDDLMDACVIALTQVDNILNKGGMGVMGASYFPEEVFIGRNDPRWPTATKAQQEAYYRWVEEMTAEQMQIEKETDEWIKRNGYL